MGHAILYCATCQIQLKDQDFDRGAGFRIDALSYCKKCARAAIKLLPPEKVTAMLDLIAREAMAEEEPAPSRTGKATERRLARPVEEPAKPARLGLWLGGVCAAALIVVAVYFGTSKTPDSRPPQDIAVTVPVRPPAPSPPPPAPTPPADRREPDPAEVQRKAKELEAVRVREESAKELAQVAERFRTACAAEQFGEAKRILAEAKKRHPDADALAELAKELSRDAKKRLDAVKAEAVEARRKGVEATVQALLARVAAWELPKLLQELEAALPAVPPPPVSVGARALAQARNEALAQAAGREFATAAETMNRAAASISEEPAHADATADADAFRLADAAYRAAVETLVRWPKGQKIELDHVGEDGRFRRSSGTLVKADAHRLWIKEVDGTSMLYVGELPARSLAEIYLHRPAKAPEDDRAAAFLCFLEGDLEAARRIWGDRDAAVPSRLASKADPRESEARALFHRAERLHAAPGTAVDAGRICEKLLQEHAETGFVRRLRAPIGERALSGNEYLFSAGDLAAGGTFRLAASEKLPSYWSSIGDSEPAARKNSYVEAAFSVRGDTEYRCWVYAGGCCAETMAFGFQATDLRAEPGGDAWLPGKQNVATSFRTHAGHGGKKQPSRWGWVQIPLPRYAADKTCKVRIVTDQEGFSAAYVFVSSAKTMPPTEADLKKLSESVQTQAMAPRKGLRILCYKWKASPEAVRDAEALQLAARRDPRLKVDLVEDSLADVRLSDYDVFWISTRTIKPTGKPVNQEIHRRADELKKFVEAGGIVWCSGQDDDSFNGAWLPYPVGITGGSKEAVALTPGPGHDLFSAPHKIDPPNLVGFDDSWKDWDSRYQVLGVREKTPANAVLLLLRHGRGCYFLAAVSTKDAGHDEIHSKLFENGLNFISKLIGRSK